MGHAARKIEEPPFELEMQIGGGGPGDGLSNSELLTWLRDSLDLAGSDATFDAMYEEAQRRGLKLY